MSVRAHTKLMFLIAVLAVASCKRTQPNFCPTATDQNCLELDASRACMSDHDCSGNTAVCDVAGSKMCVQCTSIEAPACGGTTPICGADNVCQGCTAHAQCPSLACLPDGSCADERIVAYVAPGGSGKMCTRDAPCGTLADGIAKANISVVKIAATAVGGGSGVVKDNKPTTINGQAVTIVADPGAKLDRDGDGPIIQVQNAGANVQIVDLEISGATGANGGDAIDLIPNGGNPTLSLLRVTLDANQGLGLSSLGGTATITQSTISGNNDGGMSMSGGTSNITESTISGNAGGGLTASGGTLTVSQSTISGNNGGGVLASGVNGTLTLSRSTVTANIGGGLSFSGTGFVFDITNNFITYNGVAAGPGASQVGGASLLPNTAGSKFEFNTVAFNGSDGTIFSGGVTCTGAMVSAVSNISYGNSEGTMTSDATQTRGACQYGNTLALGSVAGDLGFKSPRMKPFDFHLTAASPPSVVNAAGPCTGVDFDGDTRPIGPACDLGADEYNPGH